MVFAKFLLWNARLQQRLRHFKQLRPRPPRSDAARRRFPTGGAARRRRPRRHDPRRSAAGRGGRRGRSLRTLAALARRFVTQWVFGIVLISKYSSLDPKKASIYNLKGLDRNALGFSTLSIPRCIYFSVKKTSGIISSGNFALPQKKASGVSPFLQRDKFFRSVKINAPWLLTRVALINVMSISCDLILIVPPMHIFLFQ